jgi:hypothetical protein
MNRPPPTPATAEALVAAQMADVRRMLDHGHVLLDAITAQVETGLREDAGRRIDGVREDAYAKITKAMRYVIVLQTRVFHGGLCQASPRRTKQRTERKALVAEAVEGAIAREAETDEAAERLIENLDTRLEAEAPEDYDRPIGEMVAVICQGLGITPNWAVWKDTEWAQEEIATHPLGSPYASWPRADLRLAHARAAAPVQQTYPRGEPDMTEEEWLALYGDEESREREFQRQREAQARRDRAPP